LRKSIFKRVTKLEQHTFQPRWRVVVKDFDGSYRGECGDGLSQMQFDVWVKQQDNDTQVIIVEFNENMPAAPFEKEFVTLKVENHCDKNTSDLLKDYEESLNRANEANLLTAGIDGYSEQEKSSILDAYKIIREHNPVVPREGMHR
jgi:hypothetical protein